MKVLISPVSLDEGRAVIAGGADIVDLKNPAEGSLGASFPWIIRSVAESLGGAPDITVSATLGDLPYKPGTAALAALGAIAAGARYVKAGLHGTRDHREALEVMQGVVRTCRESGREVTAVAAGYADYRRFGGLDPLTIVRVAAESGADLAMLDTAIKDGRTLFEALSQDEIAAFIGAARATGLLVALAGGLRLGDLPTLRRLAPDVVGIRGAVCRGQDRGAVIDTGLVRAFVAAARMPAAA
jgi:(5-formylfuran-3-yl)methyl phosphate synthase